MRRMCAGTLVTVSTKLLRREQMARSWPWVGRRARRLWKREPSPAAIEEGPEPRAHARARRRPARAFCVRGRCLRRRRDDSRCTGRVGTPCWCRHRRASPSQLLRAVAAAAAAAAAGTCHAAPGAEGCQLRHSVSRSLVCRRVEE
jgi:hypothetical protein